MLEIGLSVKGYYSQEKELSVRNHLIDIQQTNPQGWQLYINHFKEKREQYHLNQIWETNDFLYLPIINVGDIFALGVFKTEKEAEEIVVKFLRQHYDFAPWLTKIKERYLELFSKKFPGLRESLFDFEDIEYFWAYEFGSFTVEYVRAGTSYDFTSEWVSENNIRKAILSKKCFSVDLDWYVSEYPCI